MQAQHFEQRLRAQLVIRLRPLERALLERAAVLRQESLSAFIRDAALGRARRLFAKEAGDGTA
jgi:uncharacterized protein (DUF1778 family)